METSVYIPNALSEQFVSCIEALSWPFTQGPFY